MAIKIPPMDRIEIHRDVKKVPHGYDISLKIRGLKVGEEINHTGAVMMAWIHLTNSLKAGGCNIDELMRDLPTGEMRPEDG